MKELSIEEKAKRYDEAIKVAKGNYETIVQMDNDCTFAKEGIVNTFHHIFPELKESEDERVRKEIISAIKEDWPGHTDWIDWLEKQGEQKPAIKFKIGDIIKCGLSTLKVANINYNKNFYELKTKEGIVVTCISFAEQDKWELVEQNPAEDRYMEGYLNGVNDISKTLKPAVWSEEDENLFKCAIDAVKQESKVRTDGCLDEEVGEMVIDWLKSLKDRYTWKPSEYELKVLKLAAEKDGACLMGLYEDLKKLREEDV